MREILFRGKTNKMEKILKAIFTWIWCFPQMLVGLIIRIATRAEHHGDHYRYNYKHGSVTLGTYIFLCPSHWGDEETLKHEQGHIKQSYILGWLYLIVIGLPSLIWCCCFDSYRRKYNKSYYDFYTEAWANKLGGVEE